MKLRSILAALLSLLTVAAANAAGPLEGPGSSGVPGIIHYQGRVTVGGVNFTGNGQFKFALVDGGVNQSQTATAFASTDGSSLTNITLLNFGSGYATPPTVTISAPDLPIGNAGGVQATAVAVVSPNGNIARIEFINHGVGYTNTAALTVTIAPPPANLLTTTYWSNDYTSAEGSAPAAAVTLGVNAGLYAVPLGDASLANMQTIPASVFQNPDVRLRVWFDDGTHGSQLLSPDQRITSVGYAMVANLAATVSDGAITGAKLANGAVGSAQIANGAIAPTQLFTSAVPQAGQVLSYDAANVRFDWVTAGLSLPFTGSGSSANALISLTNTGTGAGIYGLGVQGDGVFGKTNQAGASGVYGRSDTFTTGQGVYGYSAVNGIGVLGVSEGNDGISGRTNAAGKSGVFGFAARSDNNAMAAVNSLGTGLFAKTEGLAATAGFFWNSAGGDAIRTDGKASLNGDVMVNGGLAVGQTVITSSSENLACGHWNYLPGPLDFLTPKSLFQVGNGTANFRSNAFAVAENGDCSVGRNLHATAITAGDVGSLARSLEVNGTTAFNGEAAVISGGFRINGGNLTAQNLAFKHGDLTWDVGSDARLKDVQGDFAVSLGEIARLHTVRFTYKEGNPHGLDPRQQHVGVIAQELREVIPGAVTEGADGYLTVKADSVIWALVNSVKELKAENDALKKQLATDNAALKSRLEALESAQAPSTPNRSINL